MNKLVIFDLDGVLVDARELHYKILNHSITKGYSIPLQNVIQFHYKMLEHSIRKG